MDVWDVVVVGSGFAGLTSAIYLARYGRRVLVIKGGLPGGQLVTTTDVENYPGFAEPVSGPWLTDQLAAQASRCGAESIDGIAVGLGAESEHDRCIWRVDLDNRTSYSTKAVIVASGAVPKWVGAPGESEFLGYGVSNCATCDGPFFKGKVVVVVGGGNSAVGEALHLSGLAKLVYLVHRRDKLRADDTMQRRLTEKNNVRIVYNHVLEEVLGLQSPKRVTKASLKAIGTNGDFVSVDADGVFIAIGHTPNTSFVEDVLQLDGAGYIAVHNGTHTSAAGVFAAGDVQDSIYRQAVTAAGSGCMAAMDADRYLAQKCGQPSL